MKRITLSMIFLLCFNVLLLGQSKDTMYFKRNKFVYSGVEMNHKQAMEIMKNTPDALQTLKKANNNLVIASLFGYVAGFGLGFPLGQMIVGNEPQYAFFGVAGGAIACGLPFDLKSRKLSKKAVRQFNDSILKLAK